ncbi:hypothetical protein TNCT_532491 [Trichonephila clavata]|uniref:Uncharacterized protein n=1 Tax=Trichonephila clavata TaxID=2740835 RepID=A0A8X6GGN7_TRICU|nr:hypothetical protein TNCT_532491 [Trichonephila clavata]
MYDAQALGQASIGLVRTFPTFYMKEQTGKGITEAEDTRCSAPRPLVKGLNVTRLKPIVCFANDLPSPLVPPFPAQLLHKWAAGVREEKATLEQRSLLIAKGTRTSHTFSDVMTTPY